MRGAEMRRPVAVDGTDGALAGLGRWAGSLGGQRVLVGVAMLAMLFLRRPEAFLHPQFWAEDGVFYCDALYAGPKAFLTSYAGYFHLVPRFIAWLAHWVDPRFAPTIFLYSAVAVTVATGLLLLSRRLPLGGQWAMALGIVLVPHTGEIFHNPTNLQWIMALGLLATVLKADPDNVGDWLTDLTVLLLAGLSGPFTVFLLPLALARWILRRTEASFALLCLAAVPAAAQGVEFLHFVPAVRSTPDIDWPHLGGFLALHVPLALGGAAWWGRHLSVEKALVAGGVAVAVILLWTAAGGRRGALARWSILGFGGMLLAAACVRLEVDRMPPDNFANGDRYFVLPRILLLWLVASSAGWATRPARLALLTWLVLIGLGLPHFRLEAWPDQRWRDYCDKVRVGDEVTVPCNPGWTIHFERRVRH